MSADRLHGLQANRLAPLLLVRVGLAPVADILFTVIKAIAGPGTRAVLPAERGLVLVAGWLGIVIGLEIRVAVQHVEERDQPLDMCL
ncbi:hypothetical protein [uncultured Enterovirga sp.]|uniref:hypothetical protein n=1 Tax=uncultured Enterovirga sp. TaxID=2026352 RepID=UPI0035CA4843